MSTSDQEAETKAFKQLINDSNAFAIEMPLRNWLEVIPTVLLVLGLAVTTACISQSWWALIPSTLLGILLIRTFIFLHDVLHGALFRNSRAGRCLIYLFSPLYVYSPWVWKHNHNDHHRRNCYIDDDSLIGQPLLYSTDHWPKLTRWQQFAYVRFRSLSGMICGFFPWFYLPMFKALRQESWPLRIIDLIWMHFPIILILTIGFLVHWQMAWWLLAWPLLIAVISGGILFYVQHNAPGLRFRDAEHYSYGFAALNSSSFLDLPRWGHWLTGNIGYHHVHHANARIPFYRLPEAMRAIPALHDPVRITASPTTLWQCLRLQLWDQDRQQLVRLKTAKAKAAPST